MAESQVLCALSDLEEAKPRRFELGSGPVVVVRIAEQVFALEDRCSHEDFALSEGLVDTDTCEIECARHGAMFSLVNGDACSLPAVKAVPTVDVAVVNGQVEVTLP